jgi:peptide/nickel transport system substrate-binding protein
MARRRGRVVAFEALAAALLLCVLPACSGTSPSPSEPKAGGTLVFGAEQYPKCLNTVTSCYSASWLHYMGLVPTLPQLLTLSSDNAYLASPLVKEVPSFENGGLTKNPFTVTYRLNPKAVWEDGSPITGEDVKFTWKAYRDSAKSIFTRSGYDKISDVKVDGTVAEGQKVTLVFSEPYAPWRDKFGGGGEYVLKAAAFGANPDVSDKMQRELGFSGGPFKILSFTEAEMVLVRNDRYWDRKAYLDKIVFRSMPETASQITAFRTGEIQAFYPQPTDQLKQIRSIPGGVLKAKAGTVFEGIWLNLDQFPVNQREVREALLYGLDRKAALNAVVKSLDPKAEINRCLWSVPVLDEGKWCNNDFPTAPDPDRAKRVLEQAGWRLGPDKIYVKDGKRLVVPLATTSGNSGREQFQGILKEKARAVGIEIVPDNSDSTTLFQIRLPARTFTAGMFAQVATPDPSVTAQLASDQIPSAQSSSGQNYYGWRDPEATQIMKASDAEIDDVKRIEEFRKLGQLMARDIVSIPLYPKPQILVTNSNKVGGVGDFNAGQIAFGSVLSRWYLQ